MPISFTISVSRRDWDEDLGGWRCSALRIPGAEVTAVFVAGKQADDSWYQIVVDHAALRWARPEVPESALIALRLTEDLSTAASTKRWKRLAVVLPALATVAAALITALVPGLAGTRRAPDNAASETTSPAAVALLASFDFQSGPGSRRGSSPDGWNDENVTISDGLLCTPPGEEFRAAFYAFDLDPSSFSFSMRFRAQAFEGPSEANNFEGTDNIVTLGEGYRWFALRENRGRVELTFNNQQIAQVLNEARIAPGVWHTLFVSVDEQTKAVLLLVDGINEFAYSLPEDFRFAVHEVLSEVPTEAGFSLVNPSNGSRFEGCVDYIDAYSRAMTADEMRNQLALRSSREPS